MSGARRALGALLWAVVVGTLACSARPPARPAAIAPRDAGALIAALAARENALLNGARVSMTVRAADGGALSSSRAYLAVDGPQTLRLQILSLFGVTVLDLAIAGDAYELSLPLRGETKRGTIDLAGLAAGAVAPGDRMIVGLALLFRAKIRPDACTVADGATVHCTMADGVVVRVDVDAAGRPIRERYGGADGAPLLTATFADYAGADPLAPPGRIEISDPVSGGTMVARVLRFRRVGGART